jgi:hypothetical protein
MQRPWRVRCGALLIAVLVLPVVPTAGAVPTSEIAPAPSGKPMYYTRKIKDSDLKGRNLRELSLLRNTIFARAGNPFRRKWLHAFFASQPWYHPLAAMDATKLTKVDKANAQKIVEFQTQMADGESGALAPIQDLVARELKVLPAKAKSGTATLEDIIELQLLSAREGKWLIPDNVAVDHRSPMEDFRMLDKQLTLDDLADLSRRDLRILRNAVYARHGYSFKSPVLAWYFQEMRWYKPNPAFKAAMLSEVENRNVKLIRSLEDSLGGPMKDKAQAEEEGEGAKGWLYGA